MKDKLLSSLLILFFSGVLAACHYSENKTEQSGQIPLDFLPVLNGDYFKLNSQIIGRPYHIYVRYPEGYDETEDQQYPVIYLLDGDSLFPILAANHIFLTFDDNLPEAFIVGIAYGGLGPSINKRSYDFSTPATDGRKDRGGAADFHRFLDQELMPEVESRYAIDPERRILFGQSRGGHFVLYSAFQHPDTFWGRIASNPTLLPHPQQFYATPVEAMRDDLTLVVASGANDRPTLRKDALAWYSDWQQRDDAPWSIHFATIASGTHAANSTDAYRIGLGEIFEGDKRVGETSTTTEEYQ